VREMDDSEGDEGSKMAIVGTDTGYFTKSCTTLRAYINLFRGHKECFESHDVAKYTEFYLRLDTVQSNFHW
jgi:hypothetical protein